MNVTPTTRRGGARSRLVGQPATLPSDPVTAGPARQMALPIDDDPCAATPSEVLPGVVYIPNWLGRVEQRRLADDFRRWALPPAGLRHPACRPATS